MSNNEVYTNVHITLNVCSTNKSKNHSKWQKWSRQLKSKITGANIL